MAVAVGAIADMQGGLAVVEDGKVIAQLPCPSPASCRRSWRRWLSAIPNWMAARKWNQAQEPFMVLSFLALPVIPA